MVTVRLVSVSVAVAAEASEDRTVESLQSTASEESTAFSGFVIAVDWSSALINV